MSKPINCPLCLTPEKFELETKNVFGNPDETERAFYHCKNCDVFFQWPCLTPSQEEKFYSDEFEKFMETRNSSGGLDWSGPEKLNRSNKAQKLRRELYLEPIYLETSTLEHPTLLEVGCSSGFMISDLLGCYGIMPTGVEPSGSFLNYLQSQNIESFESIDALKKSKKNHFFDIITNFFVLEHIQKPAYFISTLYSMLKPGGWLIIEIPNAMDPLRTLFPTEAFGNFYWSIAHPWYFTRNSVEYVLRQSLPPNTFWRVFGDQRYDIGNHTRWMLKGKPGGQGGLTHIFPASFDLTYKSVLIESGYCDTLVIKIKKGMQ